MTDNQGVGSGREPTRADADQTSKIRDLNDEFRQSLAGGKLLITRGVSSLGQAHVQSAIERVRHYAEFTPDNDPYFEHDFGSFELGGRQFFWKIEYYDLELKYGSADPSDPACTARVLTIMLAEDW